MPLLVGFQALKEEGDAVLGLVVEDSRHFGSVCKRSQKNQVFVDADVDIPAMWYRGKSDRADYDCPDGGGLAVRGEGIIKTG